MMSKEVSNFTHLTTQQVSHFSPLKCHTTHVTTQQVSNFTHLTAHILLDTLCRSRGLEWYQQVLQQQQQAAAAAAAVKFERSSEAEDDDNVGNNDSEDNIVEPAAGVRMKHNKAKGKSNYFVQMLHSAWW